MANELVYLDSGGCIASLTNGTPGQIMTIGAGGTPAWAVPSDDQTAAEVPFTPYSSLAATNVQAAIQELLDECCHAAVTVDPTSNPALTVTSGQVAKLDLSLTPDADTANCELPTKIVGGDNKLYNFAKLFPDPEFQEIFLPNYYVAGNSVPGSATTAGVVSGTISVTNNSCRPRIVRFAFQGWAFMNFLAQNEGCNYAVFYDLNAAGFTLDHTVKLNITGDPTVSGNGTDFKSFVERYSVVPVGATASFAIRVDFNRLLGIINAGFLDTGYANCILSAMMI